MSDDELEALVRAFLAAYRTWEVSANEKSEIGRVDADRHEAEGDEGWDYEATNREIAADYQAFLARFVTDRVMAEDVPPTWQDPAPDRVGAMQIVDVAQRGDNAVVRTLEKGHRLLPPDRYEYHFKRMDGRWRLDDRRTRGLDGRWIHRVF